MQFIKTITDAHKSMNTNATMGTLQVGNWYTRGTSKGVYLGSVNGEPITAHKGPGLHSRMRHLRQWVLANSTADAETKRKILVEMIENA